MANDERIYNLLEKIYIELQDTKKELQDIKDEMKEEFKGVNERLDRIENKLDDIEANNADRHVAIGNKLNKVSRDLDFLTHKEFQTEKELYDLKQRLIRQRKNIK